MRHSEAQAANLLPMTLASKNFGRFNSAEKIFAILDYLQFKSFLIVNLLMTTVLMTVIVLHLWRR